MILDVLLWPLCFAAVVYVFFLSFFFSLPNLRGPLADRHQTLASSIVTQIYEIRSEIWGAPSVRNLAAHKT